MRWLQRSTSTGTDRFSKLPLCFVYRSSSTGRAVPRPTFTLGTVGGRTSTRTTSTTSPPARTFGSRVAVTSIRGAAATPTNGRSTCGTALARRKDPLRRRCRRQLTRPVCCHRRRRRVRHTSSELLAQRATLGHYANPFQPGLVPPSLKEFFLLSITAVDRRKQEHREPAC